ncbi:MAG: subclass B1 metallo-beta-lactamase [Pontixanthobacter sp.]
MKRLLLLAVALVASSCTYREIRPSIAEQSNAVEGAERYGPMRFQPIAPGIWQHTSYLDLPGFGAVPSNGLIVVDGDRSVLVDTAWNVGQTRALIEWAALRLGKPIRAAVVTHAHSDKMGGMAALHDAGIATYAHAQSNRIAPDKDLLPAQNALHFDQDGSLATPLPTVLEPLVIFYPGPGHTDDNITIGIRGRTIVFGGCLIKAADAQSLGNLQDADIAAYPRSVARFAAAFPDAQTIVMSHAQPGTPKAIRQTLKLAEAEAR